MSADVSAASRPPLIPARVTMADVTADVLRPIERPGKLWYLGLAVSLAALAFGVWAVAVQQMKGVGVMMVISFGPYRVSSSRMRSAR